MGFQHLPDPPRIKDERVLARQAGAALAAQLAAEISALQRMHVFLNEGEVELQDMVQEPHRLYAGGLGAAEDRLDMLCRIIQVPGIAIDALPVARSHRRMAGRDVLEVVFVHVGVHPYPVPVELLVVGRAG